MKTAVPSQFVAIDSQTKQRVIHREGVNFAHVEMVFNGECSEHDWFALIVIDCRDEVAP